MLFTKGKWISTMEKSGKPPFNQIIKGNICNIGTNGLYLPLMRCKEETTNPREIPAQESFNQNLITKKTDNPNQGTFYKNTGPDFS